jgi:hypothetical protein
VDKIMERLVHLLEIEQTPYSSEGDPTKKLAGKTLSWDFAKSLMTGTKRMYLDQCTKAGKRISQGKVSEKEVKVPKVDSIEEKCDSHTPIKEELIVKAEPDQEIAAKNDAKNVITGENNSIN